MVYIEQEQFWALAAMKITEKLIEEGTDEKGMFMVWYCKTLANHKALFGCIGSKKYFEATYNGDTGDVYVDTYSKESNDVVNRIETR